MNDKPGRDSPATMEDIADLRREIARLEVRHTGELFVVRDAIIRMARNGFSQITRTLDLFAGRMMTARNDREILIHRVDKLEERVQKLEKRL